MVNFKSEDINEYLIQVKNSIRKNYGEKMNEVAEEAFLQAIEIGIENTIASLYDTNVNDDEIISALNKFWGINKNEAESRIIYEKSKATIRELEYYLKMQGWDASKINQFMKSNMVRIKIRHNNELWKLRRKPEKLMQEVQKPK